MQHVREVSKKTFLKYIKIDINCKLCSGRSSSEAQEQAKEDADSAIGEVEEVGAEVEEKVDEALHGGDGS